MEKIHFENRQAVALASANRFLFEVIGRLDWMTLQEVESWVRGIELILEGASFGTGDFVKYRIEYWVNCNQEKKFWVEVKLVRGSLFPASFSSWKPARITSLDGKVRATVDSDDFFNLTFKGGKYPDWALEGIVCIKRGKRKRKNSK